jgi:hypothetical protein
MITQVKECPEGKILNPETKRCVNINSAIAKKILASLKPDKNDINIKAKKPVIIKKCPTGKILNPNTNRCINENSIIAKQLLALLKHNIDKKVVKSDEKKVPIKVDKSGEKKVVKKVDKSDEKKVVKKVDKSDEKKVVKKVDKSDVNQDNKHELIIKLKANEVKIEELLKRNEQLQLMYDNSTS